MGFAHSRRPQDTRSDWLKSNKTSKGDYYGASEEGQ